MRPLTLSEVADITSGVMTHGDLDASFERVVTDTRHPLPERSLFVALRGDNFDAHAFIAEAARRGAHAALVEQPIDPLPDGLEHVLVVEDTLAALQALARAWRARFTGRVVGVTGSNGKTAVKDILSAILSREHTTWRSPGSFNSQVGVALSLLGLRPEHDVAVIEAGISKPGEMERLARMIRPTHGVLTNIGDAHAAHLHTLENTLKEKSKLFKDIEQDVITPGADSTLAMHALDVDEGHAFWVLGEDDGRPGTVVHSASRTPRGWTFELRLGAEALLSARIDGRAEHDLANAAAAAAAAHSLGASVRAIREGLAAWSQRPSRLEQHTTPDGITLINDSYSADPTSAAAALSTLSAQSRGARAVAILGDMLDLGALAVPAHAELGAHAARSGVDLLITTGEHRDVVASAARDAGVPRVLTASLESELHELLAHELTEGDVVLLKASGAVGLERAASRLLESLGPTKLTIDLDAVRHNFHALRRRVGAGVAIMAVVKSYGYGNDATQVSRALVREGVDALGVAYADEGVALRRAGLELPILVTNSLAHEADKIVRHDLTALLSSSHSARALAREARARGKDVSAHIEVDTGMRRAGLSLDELPGLLTWLLEHPELHIDGVMTHFAAADEPLQDDFTRAQLERFDAALELVHEAGFSPTHVHAANTAAAWRFPEARYGMVRMGLGLYGLHPSEAVAARARHTRPALTFSTRIVDVRRVAAGVTVGYGRTWRAERETSLATIAAGYNDGLPRFMSNGGEVLVAGARCPIVGNVCMDVAMVDVTELDPKPAPGDEVVIFGEQLGVYASVDDIARRGSTISYELLCNVSPRVRRIFSHGE